MGEVSTIGLDLAKAVFQAHGADRSGAVVFRKKLRRDQLLAFFAGQPRCLMAMEAREITALGHETRLIPPVYVKPGKPRVDDQRLISGILHILKTGGRWRDVPPEYGPAKTIYNRYTRWARRGVWQRIFAEIAAAGPIPKELALDSSNVKAHRLASGGKGGSSAKRLVSRAAAGQRRSIVWPMVVAGSSPSR